MIIEPVIKGVVARSCHPYGCQQAVRKQIDYVQQAKPIEHGAKRVLVLGASSGFGLASRIAHTFGGAEADTIGVSFERGPSEKGVGSAGWYNNIFFRQEAEKAGRIATNIVGDAFSQPVRQQVIEAINKDLGGQVDLVVYSLATGVRPNPETGEMWHSVIKTTGQPVVGPTLNLETDSLAEMTVEKATEQEIADTVKVMGGEDWADWIQCLSEAGVLAQGCRTVAYSYIGPEVTYPIYHHGTLGRAKEHMHTTADTLNTQLAAIGGQAHVAVCKALVTKASVFIPAFTPYMLALFKVMKQKGTHEGCIEQMQRLFNGRFYTLINHPQDVPTDEQRLIRMDDWELDPEVQQQVSEIMARMSAENFTELGDYAGYKQDFMALNGFGLAGVDYQQDISLDSLIVLQP
ncbi:enoyl-[acyl-carrier-protein] reductase FabV [Photobacterium gaetbulicola]|uniref:Enoyl-[acyl-carrier-protein] reductase [NADH] n=1 Tax=Photobacterium gaetbulicola Gung47 TaxID=658445 RepID=A0A0C5WK54_9GAMM|nr:enoyl-ACP reductase FabV [Photobacterium gaetbulicola]AJR06612.1 trans-2-enoyl-CoA reductase [Photobacterium gaetbulicola Gung47]PSU13936.1 enoyl-[acyl-carrier-protein] reductase FabV [Photobacterium gaetbulicola]